MFIGHYAPALAAAALDRRAPRLGLLFLAAQLIDIAFFILVLAGVEHMRLTPGLTVMNAMDLYSMPLTHSLMGAIGWAMLFAAMLIWRTGDRRAALIGGLVVLSHWPLDWLVHAPDLTVGGTGRLLGLGLWNHPYLAMPLELALVFLTVALYAERTVPVGRAGTLSLVVLVTALVAIQLAQWLQPQPMFIVDPVPARLPLSALAVYAGFACLAVWVAGTRERRPTRPAPRIAKAAR